VQRLRRYVMIGLITVLLFSLYRLVAVHIPPEDQPALNHRTPSPATVPAGTEERLLAKIERQISEAESQDVASQEILDLLVESVAANRSEARIVDQHPQPDSQVLYATLLSEPLRLQFFRRTGLQPEPQERSALVADYLKTLGLPWVVQVVSALRKEDRSQCYLLSQPGVCPERLLEFKSSPSEPTGTGFLSSLGPTSVIFFLYHRFFDHDRAAAVARTALAAVPFPIRGKTICDMGTAIGAPLVFYEQAVGPEGRVYAADAVPWSLDFVRFCIEKGQLSRTTLVPSKMTDCMLPAESVDCFVLTDVHLGPSFGHPGAYRKEVLPWLQSMARALRPGGCLILDEMNPIARSEIEQAFQPTGLVLERYLTGGDYARLSGRPLGDNTLPFVAVLTKKVASAPR